MSVFDNVYCIYLTCIFSGTEISVATLTVNYIVDQNVGIDPSTASQLFSYCQITLTAGR
jgi:MFS transporter, FHS family, L-fucose permease